MLAWLSERTDARIGLVADTLPLLPFVLPSISGAIGWVLLLSPTSGLLNAALRELLAPLGYENRRGPFDIYSYGGLIFIYTLYQVPFAYMMIASALRNLDPSLEQQSRVAGAGVFRTLRRVTMPAVLPSLGAATMLMIWHGFALYSVPVVIGTNPQIEVLSVRIVKLLTFTYPADVPGAVGLSLFVVATIGLAWFAQGRILRGNRYATIGGKGGLGGAPIRLGRWRPLGRAFFVAYVLLAAVLPLAALLVVALNGFWTPFLDWSSFSLRLFDKVLFENRTMQRSLINSLGLGFVGATIGMLVAAMMANLLRNRGGVVLRTLDAAVKLPAALSGIVIGVGFVLAFAGPPFNLGGTLAILLLAYLVQFMPKASVAAEAAAAQVGGELTEAARVGGSGSARAFFRVSLPLMVPGLVAGWAMLFVQMAGDLTVTVILSGLKNIVVGFQILDIFHGGGSFAELAALALVLTLINAAVVSCAYLYSGLRSRRLGVAAGVAVRA